MQEIPRGFLGMVKFALPGEELALKMAAKSAALTAKIVDREQRIVEIRATYTITDADLIELLMQASRDRGGEARFYSLSNAPAATGDTAKTARSIPAGVVANLQAERDAKLGEADAVERLDRILRNLDRAVRHDVSYSDLEFLGL